MTACGKPSGDSPLLTFQPRSSAHISRESSLPPNPMVESVPLPSDRSSGGWSARPLPNSSPRKCAALPARTSLLLGMKQGPELLHKIVSAHVAIHRDAAMASVDVNNAHGAVEWGAIQSEIEALDKNIRKWCAVLFKAVHELA